ncbi:hypothetical protein SAMN05421542_1984 [Chryseobacterium jejuense]|uniref:Uncharacterized protein n=1 Tax=Chryseobacterium jejuense TaxID=445960 RepID=A0A2X2VA16_CHRJE|nr:hypothetical protein SAMN05421542_1984 [Chryseobacterium jejuense]SQB27652.1 Uncharacterised protein [Chryseobacterium jejuense]
MILEINNNRVIYKAHVTKEKDFYIFRLLRCDGFRDYYEPYNFGRFTCSLQCRLKYYKDFKDRIFNNDNSPRVFKTITKM